MGAPCYLTVIAGVVTPVLLGACATPQIIQAEGSKAQRGLNGELILSAGDSICVGVDGKKLTNGHCRELEAISDSLMTPEMNARIAEAQGKKATGK